MSIKERINNKELQTPGVFSHIVTQTPGERLNELQQLYNSQEFEHYTLQWKIKMKALYDEIQEVLKQYPELSPVELKTYTLR